MGFCLLEPKLEKIEARLKELTNRDCIPHEKLHAMTEWALFPRGKRLRALITLDIGGDKALDAAIAVELFHTYSLIHDDLPSLDNDDFRRGKFSLHKQFDEGGAILTGDFLLTYGMEILANADLPAPLKCALISQSSKRIGGKGMIEGQLLDLASQGRPISWQDYLILLEKKTGDLFTLAFELGALILNSEKIKFPLFTEIGKLLGLIYSFRDDLQDQDVLLQDISRENLKRIYQTLTHLSHILLRALPQKCLVVEEIFSELALWNWIDVSERPYEAPR